MDHEVAHTMRLDFRTNLTASTNLFLFLPQPRPDHITRINWWTSLELAESGEFEMANNPTLVEGPQGRLSGFTVAAFRDGEIDGGIVSRIAAGGSTTLVVAGDSDAGAHGAPDVMTFPGGIWTVQDLFYGVATDGGVDHYQTTIGYETVKISRKDWLHWRNNGPNSTQQGQLIQ